MRKIARLRPERETDVEPVEVVLPAQEAQTVVDGGQQQHERQYADVEASDEIADLLEVAHQSERREGHGAEQEEDEQAPSYASERLGRVGGAVAGERHGRRLGR